MRSLALSGGGAQGLYTAHILSRFEEPFIENFDVVAGTSIGAALACGLVWGWTADELVELFEKNVAEIFPQSYVPHPDVGRFWKASKGVNKPRYRVEPWKDLLEEMLGDARFGEAAARLSFLRSVWRMRTWCGFVLGSHSIRTSRWWIWCWHLRRHPRIFRFTSFRTG